MLKRKLLALRGWLCLTRQKAEQRVGARRDWRVYLIHMFYSLSKLLSVALHVIKRVN